MAVLATASNTFVAGTTSSFTARPWRSTARPRPAEQNLLVIREQVFLLDIADARVRPGEESDSRQRRRALFGVGVRHRLIEMPQRLSRGPARARGRAALTAEAHVASRIS
jgi:hypothetical protein